MTQYPSLYNLAMLQAPGSAGRILAQTKALEHLANTLIDTAPENKIIISLPSYPQNDRFRVRVIDSLAHHKPVNGGVVYVVVTAWRDYEWIDKETRWLLGSDYVATIDDSSHAQLTDTIHRVQTEHLIHVIQHQNAFTGSHPDVMLSTLELDEQRLEQLAKALPEQIPCSIVALGDGEMWCQNPTKVAHFHSRIHPSVIESVGLYRFLNGSMQHSDRTIVGHIRSEDWVCSEFLLKARYTAHAALIQVVNRVVPDDKYINQICCRLLPLLQDEAPVIEATRVDGGELEAVLHSFQYYIQQSMKDLEQNWLMGLNEA